MKTGQQVICISENFPVWKTTQTDKSIIGTNPHHHPQLNEILTIDETLGEFIRFDKYDNHAFNWWKMDRFKLLNPQIMEHSEYKSINPFYT